MAMSKEVLRAATLSHGDALDKVFAEANARIVAVSNDMAGVGANMMFVTVFAGVLDLASGQLVYVSAGHDAPFVLSPRPHGSAAAGARRTATGFGRRLSLSRRRAPTCPRRDAPAVHRRSDRGGKPAALPFIRRPVWSRCWQPRRWTARRRRLTSSATMFAIFPAGAEQADDITLLAVRWLGARNGK